MITAEKNRLGATPSRRVQKEIREHIKWIERQLHITDFDLDQAIKTVSGLEGENRPAHGVPGVGRVTAALSPNAAS